MNPASLLEALLRYSYTSRYNDGLAPLLSWETSLKIVLPASGDMERRKR
jgi:hypothetical protein